MTEAMEHKTWDGIIWNLPSPILFLSVNITRIHCRGLMTSGQGITYIIETQVLGYTSDMSESDRYGVQICTCAS
jgi:hypothetical protein